MLADWLIMCKKGISVAEKNEQKTLGIGHYTMAILNKKPKNQIASL